MNNGRNISKTVRELGYPSRALLSAWVDELAPGTRKERKTKVDFSLEQKIGALCAFHERKSSAQRVAIELGVERSTLYDWNKELLGKEANAIMTGIHDEQLPDDIEELKKQKAELERELYHAKIELALRTGAIELVKKDPGADLEHLTNKERTILIDALRPEIALNDLLEHLRMAKSSYYYQRKAMGAPDKYAGLRDRIIELFHENEGKYGYRPIHELLKKEDRTVSEKIVRSIMAAEHLRVRRKKNKRYSSYRGEITPAPDNIIARNFHADSPNEKWLTDLTEFNIPAGKVYLSPIVDCFDGMVVSWTIGTSPTAELVNSMLRAALSTLDKDERPIVHSDRGCHYRWPGWIGLMDSNGLTRSMSKKGCSPDNSACEGFFGRLKMEFFYGRDWRGVTTDKFIEALDRHLRWYNEVRIKKSLGWVSPVEYRKSLRVAA
jgi:transposase InsO family protein/transposase-like protein